VSPDARVSMDDTGSTMGGMAPLTPVTDDVGVQSPTVVYAWLPRLVVLPVGVVPFHG